MRELSAYEILEVEPNASQEQIDTSYDRICAYLSPGNLAVYSMLDEEDAAELRAQLDEAYRTLTDPDRRAAYDRSRGPSPSYPPIVPGNTSGQSLGPDEAWSPAAEVPRDGMREDDAAGRRVRLKPRLDVLIGEETEFSGEVMRQLRESCEASLEEVAEITKIGIHYLRAIEADDHEGLPAAVYARGFVAEYAKVLGLDSKLVATSYMQHLKRLRGKQE